MATRIDDLDEDTLRYVRMMRALQLVQAEQYAPAPRQSKPRHRWGLLDYLILLVLIGMLSAAAIKVAPDAIALWGWYKAGAPMGQQAATPTLLPWQPPARGEQPPAAPQAPASGGIQQPLAPEAPATIPMDAAPAENAAPLAPPVIATAVINVPAIDPNVVIVPAPNTVVRATEAVPTAIPASILSQGATAYALASTPATPVPLQAACDPPFTVQLAVVKDGVPAGQVTGAGCSQAEAEANAKTLAAQMGGAP